MAWLTGLSEQGGRRRGGNREGLWRGWGGDGGAGSRSHLLFSAPAWSLVGEALRLMASCLPACNLSSGLSYQQEREFRRVPDILLPPSLPCYSLGGIPQSQPNPDAAGWRNGQWGVGGGRPSRSNLPPPQVILLRDLRLLAPGPEDMARDFEEPVIGIDRLRPSGAAAKGNQPRR